MAPLIEKQPDIDVKQRYTIAKNDVLIQMKMIITRLHDQEKTGVNWGNVANLNKVLNDLKNINELLMPF